MNMERYFKEKSEELKEVYEVLRKTVYGKKLNLAQWNINTYDDFRKLPIIAPNTVDYKELFISTKGLWQFKTTGVSGNIKTIYRDIGTIVGYPEEMNRVLRNNITVFLHSKRREGESYYETHDINHKRMYPQGIFAEYNDRDKLLECVQRGDVLFIIEYPLMAEWICYQLESALENKEILFENIAKRKVYLELSGEPVTEIQIKSLVKRLDKIFQTEVEYFITYGSNEIGHIGTYIPALHGSQIAYKIISSLFVEEINGEIIITPFRKNGTILFRYKMGDKGKLYFIDGKPFLEIKGKSKEEGVLYIAGAQVYIPEIVSKVEKVIPNCPVGIECVKKEYPQKGMCELSIITHIPQPLNTFLQNEISSVIKQYIMDSAILSVENHLGIVRIDVRYSSEPMRKRWRIGK